METHVESVLADMDGAQSGVRVRLLGPLTNGRASNDVRVRQSRNHLTKHRVLLIELRSRSKGNKELTVCRVARLCLGHLCPPGELW